MNLLQRKHTSKNLATYLLSSDLPSKVIVVRIEAYETKEQAWERYLQEHPKDESAPIKIFHCDHRENA